MPLLASSPEVLQLCSAKTPFPIKDKSPSAEKVKSLPKLPLKDVAQKHQLWVSATSSSSFSHPMMVTQQYLTTEEMCNI